MVEQLPSFKSRSRNITVVVAFWILGLIFLLEIMMASNAYAPRVLKALRNNQSVAAAPSTPTQARSQLPNQSLQRTPAISSATDTPPLSNTAAPLPSPTAESSLQGDTALAIVSAKLEGSDAGPRKLLITIKSNPKISIDVPQVKVQVYFYDTDGTEITPSKAQVTSNWISPPIDWKDKEPEILEVKYLPDTVDSQIRFAGYVVAIYYKGDLQDYRAEPAQLKELFPLKYFIGTDE